MSKLSFDITVNSSDFSTTCKIYVPDESVNVYKNANVWSQYSNRIYPLSSL